MFAVNERSAVSTHYDPVRSRPSPYAMFEPVDQCVGYRVGLFGEQRMSGVRNCDERRAIAQLLDDVECVARRRDDVVGGLDHEHRSATGRPPLRCRYGSARVALDRCGAPVPAAIPHGRVVSRREERGLHCAHMIGR